MAREIKDELNPHPGAEGNREGLLEEAPLTEAPSSETMGIQLQVSEEMQDEIVSVVMDDYESAKRARDERNYGTTSKGVKLDFEKWRKELLDLYNSERIPKTIPWKFCSNRSLRIAKSILDMLHARLFPSVINENLLKFRAENVASFPKLDRIEKLMHWWLFIHGRVRQFFDDWVKVNLGFGDSITETSWEAKPRDQGKTNESPVTDTQGNPIMEQNGMPSVVTSRVISLIEKSTSTVYTRDKFFLQKGSMDIEYEPVILEKTYLYRDLELGETQGKFVNIQNLLREKLPFSKEKMTGLAPEEVEKMKDIKLRNQPVEILTEYLHFDADGDGFPEDIRVYVSKEYRIYLGGVPLTQITKSGRRPLDFTKIESRLEAVSENFGYGVLEGVKELAEEIDALFNQISDGNTLAVMMPGFYDPGGDLDAPSLQLSPNKMTPVSDPQHNLFFPTINSPTEKLISAIRLVLEFIERLTAASSYVMGKESEIVGGSGTATRTNAIVSAANERFGMPSERLRQGAANIVRHHLDILQLNIPPGLEQRILGDDGNPIFQPNELSMEGIAGEYDAYLLPDPSAGSQETAQQVGQTLYSILMQNPLVASDPTKIYHLTAEELLKPFGKEPKAYLGPAPDQDMVDDPSDENTLILQGMFKKVVPQLQENHQLHIQKHQELMQSPSLAAVPPALVEQVLSFTQQHILQHMQMQQMVQSIMMKNTGGPGGRTHEPGGVETKGVGGLPEPGGKPGMEQVPGPLGSALESKRAGEVSRPPGRQG